LPTFLLSPGITTYNQEARMPKKNYEAQMPAPHAKLPEMDWFESTMGKMIRVVTLTGDVITGTLVSYSTYALFVKLWPTEHTVMYFKHGLLSIEHVER
jgi:hypothetical protein